VWKYTTVDPGQGWNTPGFQENKNCPWKSGKAGFGRVGKPADRVKTPWKTPDIWMRSTYVLPKGLDLAKLSIEACHDEDFEVYINGVLAATGAGHRNDYALFAINPTARKASWPETMLAVLAAIHAAGLKLDMDMSSAVAREFWRDFPRQTDWLMQDSPGKKDKWVAGYLDGKGDMLGFLTKDRDAGLERGLIAKALAECGAEAGRLGVVDNSKGRQGTDGVIELPSGPKPTYRRADAYAQTGDMYQYPYPLDESTLLVSYDPIAYHLREKGVRGFSFPKEIQPILDRHCVKCHKPDAKGKGRNYVLTGEEVLDKGAKRKWYRSYLTLTNTKSRGSGYFNQAQSNELVNWISNSSVPTMIPPRHGGSTRSKLISMLEKGHEKVKLSHEEMDKLCAWIDLTVPFCGDSMEANAWNEGELKKGAERMKLRREADQRDLDNIKAMLQATK